MNKFVLSFLLLIVIIIGNFLNAQVFDISTTDKRITITRDDVVVKNILKFTCENNRSSSHAIGNVVNFVSCADEYYLKSYASDTLSVNMRDAVVTSTNEQIVVGGLSNSNNPDNVLDPFIIKLGSNGEKIWEKNYSVAGNQFMHSVTRLSDGNYLAVGIDNVINDVLLILEKFDTDGNVIWRKTHLFTGISPLLLVVKKVKEDEDANLILTGGFYVGGSPRLLYIKCSASGTVLLSKSLRPPNMAIITGAADMLVKDGFTYLSGQNLSTNFMNGLLVKINNASGAVVWAKQYDFNNRPAAFYQILLYNNQICLLGLNGNYQSDTSIIMLADTSGLVNTANYIYYPGYREPGRAMIKNDGKMIWLQNTNNDFSISEFLPPTGIVWTKRYTSLNDFPRILHAFEGDNNSIIFTGHDINGNKSELFSGRFAGNGESPCTPVAVSPGFGNGTSVSNDILFAADNIIFQEITRNWMLANEKVHTIDTICQSSITCDTLDISATGSVCTGDTLKIVVYKDCSLLPSYIYDSSQIRLISTTDTLLKFVSLNPGQVIIVANMDNGCTIIKDSVSVTVHKAANTLSLGSDASLCNGNSILLNAHSGYSSYQWQDGSSDSIYIVNSTGLYYVTVLDFCGRTFRDSIVINSGPGVPLSIGPDRTKCNNDTLHLNAPGGYINYSWYPDYNINSLVNQSVVINPLVDTVYYLKAEFLPGCFEFDTVRITVNNSPAIQLGADTSLCSGQSLSLDAGNGFNSYAWSNGGIGRVISVNSSGSFFVTATTAQGCSSSDTIKLLNVHSLPVVTLDSNNELCTGSTRILDAGAYTSFLWNNGTVARTIPVQTTGTYYVSVTDANGCKGSDTTKINTLLPLPKQFLPPDTSMCSYGALTIQPSGKFSSYIWNNGSTLPSTVITVPGMYWLEVKDEKHCTGKDSIIVITKQCLPGLFVPSAFTPNRDGTNDVMRAILIGDIKSFEFKIFNRYGQLVFFTRNSQEGWDGSIKGIKQETGGFVWICTYRLGNESSKTERGNVILIR